MKRSNEPRVIIRTPPKQPAAQKNMMDRGEKRDGSLGQRQRIFRERRDLADGGNKKTGRNFILPASLLYPIQRRYVTDPLLHR
jgi:hypothetical protein